MNIQIFGKNKCFDTKKAQRYFKERNIKFQFVEINKFGLSKGEFQSVKSASGGTDALLDENSKEYQFYKHFAREEIEERLIENPGMFKTPIVRCGKKATVGYKPEIWETWLN